MFVVEILPLTAAMRHGTLSYFSTIEYSRGAVVNVPLRNKDETGVVLSTTPAQFVKTALRAATFSLRKLPPQEDVRRLSPTFLLLAEQVAHYYGTGVGATLSALLPDDESLLSLYCVSTHTSEQTHHNRSSHVTADISLLTDTERGRIVALKSLVRESFAGKKSVLIVVPTRVQMERMYRELKLGITDRTVLLGSGMGKAKRREAVEVIEKSNVPILVIATPAYAHIERADIGLVVLEYARAAGYKMRTRPYLDFRMSLQAYAQLLGARLVYAESLHAAEQEELLVQNKAVPFGEHPRRIVFSGTLRADTLERDNDSNEPFKIFGSEATALIAHTLHEEGRIFIYSARKGLATLIACLDCGTIVRDPESGSPLALHASFEDGIEKRWFYSSATGYRIPAFDLCPTCGSWRLRERGIGVQAVMRELATHFPKKTPILFDASTASSHKRARAIQAAFYEEGGTILIGTPAAIPYLEEPIDASIVVSMDSLLAIPSWRQAEEALGTLLSLREKTLHTVLVQTRHASGSDILEYTANGDIGAFHERELALRREMNYPPFATFVFLTYKGKKSAVAATENNLKSLFAAQRPLFYGMPFSDDGAFTRHCLMRFPASAWPHPETAARLRTLPPHIRIEVNPDRII